MIVRSLGLRHGRKVVASPERRWCFRCMSTAPATTVTAQPLPTSPKPLAKIQAENDNAEIPRSWSRAVAIYEETAHLGSRVERRYTPGQTLRDAPKYATLELLMASQAHLGHNVSTWNPANQRYIYGMRDGIHIISLETTLAHLRRAARVVEEVAFCGGLILFVGTRRGQMPIVVRAAELVGACHLFTKWTPGTITNRDTILASMPMKIVNELDKPLEGFDTHLNDRRPLVPDLVVCLNPLENYTMLYECGLANVPTIGIIDTNVDPTWVTYQIPANDDSLRAVTVIACVLGRAGQQGRKRRLELAKTGREAHKVTWQTPWDVQKYMELTARARAEEEMKKKTKNTEPS